MEAQQLRPAGVRGPPSRRWAKRLEDTLRTFVVGPNVTLLLLLLLLRERRWRVPRYGDWCTMPIPSTHQTIPAAETQLGGVVVQLNAFAECVRARERAW